MFSRPAILLFCALLFTACGDTAGSGGALSGDGATSPTGILSVVGPTSIVVAPRGTADIQVAYREADGRAVSGIAVEFVLEGEAPAVSLTVDQNPQGPFTDEDGQLSARLTVGTDAAKFSVRANAEGTEPVYVEVEVLPSAVREVSVLPRYMGMRPVTVRTVTALPDASCDLALSSGVTGEALEQYEVSDVSRVFELGPGLHYAFVAWGRDETGSLLSQGCAELTVPVDPELELEPLIVELLDRSLMLRGSYEVSVELDVSVSAARAAASAAEGGEALLSADESDEANYDLDAIEAALRSAGKNNGADNLAAARADGSLAADLAAAFEASQVGPRAFLAALGEQLIKRGSILTLNADYGVSSVAGVPMSFSLTDMQATGADDAAAPLTFDAAVLPMTSIDATYDDARAAIAVESLSVQLALGDYAKRLLAAIDAADSEGLRGLLESASGCAELSAWAKDQAAIAQSCDESCLLAACGSARDELLLAARAQLALLDMDHPSIGVRGDLRVYDGEDDDGIVDALKAAAFQGSWGKAPEADGADLVGADVVIIN